MPYKSDKQRKFIHSQKPDIAKKWDEEIHSNNMKKGKMKKAEGKNYIRG